jgi:hypothetical protein
MTFALWGYRFDTPINLTDLSRANQSRCARGITRCLHNNSLRMGNADRRILRSSIQLGLRHVSSELIRNQLAFNVSWSEA